MSNNPTRSRPTRPSTALERNGQGPVTFGRGVNDSSASQIQFGDASNTDMASRTPPSPQQGPGGAGPRPPMMPGQHYPQGPRGGVYPGYPPYAFGQFQPPGFNPYAAQYMQPGMYYPGPGGAPVQPQATPSRAPPPQRQKKVIAIIDPNTGKEVELGKTPKHEDAKAKEAAKVEVEKAAGAEQHSKEETDKKAKEQADRLAKEEADRLEADRLAKEEAERLAKVEAERLETERLAKEEAERLEAERLAKEEAERLEAERLAKEEAERLAKVEAERLEAERLAKEEAERLEAERLAKEETERLAKAEAERLEAERLAEEEAERLAKAEAERLEAERLATDASSAQDDLVVVENGDVKGDVSEVEAGVPAERPADAGAAEELEEGEIIEEKSGPAPREPPTYTPEMWSPDNPEGKRVYPIGFLMAFMDLVTEKPSDMVMHAEVDRELAGQSGPAGGQGGSRGGRGGMQRHQSGGMGQHRQGPGGDYRGPAGPGMRREPSMGGRGGRGGRGGMMGGPIRGPSGGFGGPRVNFDAPPPMKVGENAWRPPVRIDPTKVEDPEQREKVENELLFRKLKGLLNKLTFENYDRLAEQIMALPINTNTRLKGAIYIVFDKALDEPTFATMYAKLCTLMSKWEIPSESTDEGQAKNTFRRHLLNKCQEEFEKERTFTVKEGIAAEDVDEALARQKLRMLGNIKFIGELFKLNMLTNKIMHACIQQLLTPKDGQSVPSEEALESLCQLLATVGKRLDTPEAKQHMDVYFSRVKDLVQLKDDVTSRVRFMMQDVIELRENKWVPRRAEAQAKTIQEVHKEMEQEAANKLAKSLTAGRNDSGRGGRNDSRGGYGKQQQQGADGWTSVGSNTRSKADLSALRSMQTRPASTGDSTNMKLGPAGGGGGGARGWGMARATSENKPVTGVSTTKNAFDILNHPDTQDERGPPLRPIMPTLQAPSPKGGRPHSPSAPTPSPSDMSPAPSPVPPMAEELTEDDFRKKAKATAEEYYNLKDIKEAVICLKELDSPSLHHLIAAELLVAVDNNKTRPGAAELMVKLAEEGVLTKDDILIGAEGTFEMVDDLSTDVPKLHEYLAEYFTPLVQAGVVSLGDLAACKHFPELVTEMMSQAPLKLLAATASRMENQDDAKAAWATLELAPLVPEGKEVGDILKALV